MGGEGRRGASQPELATSTPWQAAEPYAKQAAPLHLDQASSRRRPPPLPALADVGWRSRPGLAARLPSSVRKPFACLDGLLACLLCPAQEESDPSTYSCGADSAARWSAGSS